MMTDLDEARLREADSVGDAEAARKLGGILEERGDLDGAEAAFECAAERGDVTALGKLAILIDVHRDDPDAAEAAYRRADEAGSVDGAGNLGRILKDRGDLLGAEAAYRRCVDRGSVRALADYAGLLSMRGDASPAEITEVVRMLCPVEDRFNRGVQNEEAGSRVGVMEAMAPVMVFEGMWERCDQAAMEAGVRAADADGSAAGAFYLGNLLRSRGDHRESAEASERAGERGFAKGWVNAGVALSELGDLDRAEAMARRAEGEGEASGAALLGWILDERGDADGALGAWRRADAGGDGGGSFQLGVALLNRGQVEQAEEALARAEDEGVENAAALRNRAREMLGMPATDSAARTPGESGWDWGVRLERLNDLPGATSAYLEALDAREEPVGPLATLRYAEALEEQQDPAAEQAFQRIAQDETPSIRAGAWRGIARYRMERGETVEALEALRIVTETDDVDETPRALRNIGVLREECGDAEGARAAYLAAIERDHPQHSAGARVNLAQLFENEGDHAGAERLFREVIESRHPVESPRARVLLGQMCQELGDIAGALEWFESAIDDGDGEWAQRAACNAGAIYLTQRDEFARAADLLRIAERIDDPRQAALASFFRGDAERQLGNEEEALAAYRRTLAVDAGIAGAAVFAAAKQVGVILVGRGDPGGARDMFALAAQTDDPVESARGFALLGACERQYGNVEAAVVAFRQAVAIPGGPDDIRALAQRGLMELAT